MIINWTLLSAGDVYSYFGIIHQANSMYETNSAFATIRRELRDRRNARILNSIEIASWADNRVITFTANDEGAGTRG